MEVANLYKIIVDNIYAPLLQDAMKSKGFSISNTEIQGNQMKCDVFNAHGPTGIINFSFTYCEKTNKNRIIYLSNYSNSVTTVEQSECGTKTITTVTHESIEWNITNSKPNAIDEEYVLREFTNFTERISNYENNKEGVTKTQVATPVSEQINIQSQDSVIKTKIPPPPGLRYSDAVTKLSGFPNNSIYSDFKKPELKIEPKIETKVDIKVEADDSDETEVYNFERRFKTPFDGHTHFRTKLGEATVFILKVSTEFVKRYKNELSSGKSYNIYQELIKKDTTGIMSYFEKLFINTIFNKKMELLLKPQELQYRISKNKLEICSNKIKM